LWGEIATQLLLGATPSRRAARSRCALQLYSFEQLLVVVMREQLTVPWAARHNFATHSFDNCLLMTFLSSLTLQSANLARPAEGVFVRQQHNATFVPTRCRLISAMMPAASASVLSAAVKALHRAHNLRIRPIKDGHLPSERGKET